MLTENMTIEFFRIKLQALRYTLLTNGIYIMSKQMKHILQVLIPTLASILIYCMA